jgi:hypothetical protein
VFVSVRAPTGGPPLAALKLPAGPFPLDFEVTTADAIAMGGGVRPFTDQLKLVVRIDNDGNAMTRDDEPEVTLDSVDKGTTGLVLTLE